MNTQALNLITKGFISPTALGLSTHGYIIQIHEYEYTPPEILPEEKKSTGGGSSSYRSGNKHLQKPKDDKKVVVVTVFAYGKKLETSQVLNKSCLLYTSPSPRDRTRSRMPSSA